MTNYAFGSTVGDSDRVARKDGATGYVDFLVFYNGRYVKFSRYYLSDELTENGDFIEVGTYSFDLKSYTKNTGENGRVFPRSKVGSEKYNDWKMTNLISL